MDNKKKFNTNRLAAYALSGVMLASVVPYNVFANTEALNNNLEISDVIKSGQQKSGQEKAGLTEDQKKKAGQSANNWEEVISSEDDYWEIPKKTEGQAWKGRNMGGLTSV